MEKDFFELSQQINELVRNGKHYITDLQIKEERNGTLKDSDEVLENYLKAIAKQSEKIATKMLIALGQMYCGVIIPETYSIRKDGKIYPYKCRSEVSEETFLKEIAKRKEYLKERLNPKDYALFVEVLDKICEDDKFNLDIDTSIAQGKMQIQKVEVFDFDRDYSDRTLLRGIAKQVTTMTFDRGDIQFLDEENDSVSNKTIHKLLVQKYQKEIEKVRADVMNTLQAKKDFLDNLDNEVNEKLGKWIMVGQLVSDKIEKGDLNYNLW